MPLYEYECRQCHTRFERLRRVNDTDRDLRCPKCHSSKVERQISGFLAGKCSAPKGSFG